MYSKFSWDSNFRNHHRHLPKFGFLMNSQFINTKSLKIICSYKGYDTNAELGEKGEFPEYTTF